MPEKERSSGDDGLTLDSDLAELDRLREFIEGFCDRRSLPQEICYHLSVALEELVVNVVKHGACNPPSGAIRIELRLDYDCVRITFSDNGLPFDPTAAPTPDLSEDLRRRPIGGLGIHLVRCLIPEIRYERRDGRNCLFLGKPIETGAELTRQKGGTDADCHGDHPR